MKKLICHILTAILLISLLTSCSPSSALMKLEEAERADRLFDITNNITKESFLIKIEQNITGILEGMKTDMSITRDVFYIDLLSDSPKIHFEMNAEAEIDVQGETLTTKLRTRSGFRDGKMYSQNSASSSIYSKISAEEYLAHIGAGASLINSAVTNAHKSAAVKKCIRNDDGSLHATFSDFPEESFALLVSTYFDPSVLTLDGARAVGLTFEIKSTKKLALAEMKYTIHFEGQNESAATATVTLRDAEEKNLPKIDFYKFREVGDLRLIDKIREKVAEKIASGSGKFTSTDIVTQRINNNSTHKNIEGIIDYKNTESGFEFDYSYYNHAIPDATSSISYRDGIFGMGRKMSDLEARAYIMKRFDTGDMVNALVSDYRIDENNPDKYIFYIDSPSVTEYYQYVGGLPPESVESTGRIEITIKDDEIVEYRYYLSITAKYLTYSAKITQSNIRTFE